jgi:hypothetical protein
MKLNRLFSLLCAALIPAGSVLAESPKIGCAAEVGQPAGGGNHWVLVFLKPLGGAKAPPAWRLYHKAGGADAPGNYSLLTTVQATADPVTIGHVIQNATDAGLDMAHVSGRITAIVVDPAIGPGLAEKTAALMQATSEGGVIEFQRESLATMDPFVAAVAGRAVFVAVPAAVGTFEVRNFTGGVEGAVIGRATTGAAPELLPAPQALTEVPELRPQGHLRVQLRWGAPEPLRQRFLHWRGAVVYRADYNLWQSNFGAPPPAAIGRDPLLAMVADGHIVQVNRLPVLPAEVPAVPPGTGEPMFIDDNDSVAQTQLEGAPKFLAGDRYVYWVAETDLMGRPGEPSTGLEVTICDRLAPEPPRGLTVTNQRRFIDGKAQDFLRLEWPSAPATEVLRWYLYVSTDSETPLSEYALNPDNPNTPSLRLVIPNDGSYAAPNGRIRFDHLAAPGHPLQPPGKTVYYRLRAEDDTPCKVGGMGNLSGLSGPVPGARHDLFGPATVNGAILTHCWRLLALHASTTTGGTRPFTATLRGQRPAGSGISWIEFRDLTNNRFIGRYLFAPGQTAVTAEYQPGNNSAPVFAARFGHPGGIQGEWRNSIVADTVPYATHVWNPQWEAEPGPGDCPGLHLPLDPETGDPNEICAILSPNADVKSWITYVQLGVDCEKTKYASGNVTAPGMIQACFDAFPPHGGELCFYAQGFDAGGNPGPMESLGCVKVAPRNGLPVPSITGGTAALPSVPTAGPDDFRLAWNCPPGAERFDAAFTPPPPGAQQTFLEADSSGALREWGTLETPRIPTAFGTNAPEFAHVFGLVEGVNYRAKVRAVTGHRAERDEGPWSLPFTVKWLTPPAAATIPWPQRDAPGVTGAATMAWDTTDEQLRVLIGSVPTSIVSPTSPLPVDSLDPFLFHRLPLVAYLRDTTPGVPDRMLQVTHKVDKLLAITLAGGMIISDQSIKLVTVGTNTQIWLRLDQAVLNGHSYEAFLVLHDERGELREVCRSNTTAVPALIEN